MKYEFKQPAMFGGKDYHLGINEVSDEDAKHFQFAFLKKAGLIVRTDGVADADRTIVDKLKDAGAAALNAVIHPVEALNGIHDSPEKAAQAAKEKAEAEAKAKADAEAAEAKAKADAEAAEAKKKK